MSNAKYFKFIDKDSNKVESKVISYNGTIIPLPHSWTNQRVQVLFNDDTKQEFYVKDNGNMTYVMVGKIYVGGNVTVSLVSEKKSNIMSDTFERVVTGTVYVAMSVYIRVLTTIPM